MVSFLPFKMFWLTSLPKISFEVNDIRIPFGAAVVAGTVVVGAKVVVGLVVVTGFVVVTGTVFFVVVATGLVVLITALVVVITALVVEIILLIVVLTTGTDVMSAEVVVSEKLPTGRLSVSVGVAAAVVVTC